MVIFLAMRPLEQEKIAVIGLGYVGLPVAIAFGKKLSTVGFDIRQRRVDQLKQGHDDPSWSSATSSGRPSCSR